MPPLPREVTLIDVAPRDGLQNEAVRLSTPERVELVRRLVAAGVREVEVGSFVNPRVVPAMADTDRVCAELWGRGEEQGARSEGGDEDATGEGVVRFTALAAEVRGYERAAAAGIRHLRLVVAASATMNRRNIRREPRETMAEFEALARRAAGEGIGIGGSIATAWGCPYEGEVEAEAVLSLARRFAEWGAAEIVLNDTTGMATPGRVAALCDAAREAAPGVPLTCHFHNTRNTGYANAWDAIGAGVTRFDATLGGIGGCPFAPRAVGNIATDDLAHLLHGAGIATGIDLPLLLEHSAWLAERLGRELPALVGRAGAVYPHPPPPCAGTGEGEDIRDPASYVPSRLGGEGWREAPG